MAEPSCLGYFWAQSGRRPLYYSDVIMSAMVSQITSIAIVYLPFIQAQIKENIKLQRHWHLWGDSLVTGDFPHKGPVMRKIFPFDNVIMILSFQQPPEIPFSLSRSLPNLGHKRISHLTAFQFLLRWGNPVNITTWPTSAYLIWWSVRVFYHNGLR